MPKLPDYKDAKIGDEEFSDEPLTPRECRDFRRMNAEEKRVRWFWITAKNTALWITGILFAISLVWEKLRYGVKALMGIPQ